MNIAHLTSVHSRYDTRVFLKQCHSLAKVGYSVSLVVADGKGDELKNEVNVYDVGASQNRINRILKTTKKILIKAKSLDADVYHLHDPELLPIGLKLRKLGKIVIFDSHEDVPKQILSKTYLITPLGYLIGRTFSIYERYACKRMSAIVAATPYIRDKFLSINPNSIDINNFPIIDEISPPRNLNKKQKSVCYVGGIAEVRGVKEMIRALEYSQNDAKLELGGEFNSISIRNEVTTYKGWQSVNELGFLSRDRVQEVLHTSIAGLVTLHPIINYIDALPVKMFEYMSAGIPVIASNFPLWQKIIEDNNCGLCVDPLESRSIAKAIDFFINNPDKAQEMGINGRNAILQKYNWGIEERKLLSLYSCLNDDIT